MNGIRQLSALLEAHISRRRADQTADAVRLHVLGHVKSQEVDAEGICELFRQLGLAHTGRSSEQERPHGLVLMPDTGSGHLDVADHLFNRFVLPVDDSLKVLFQVT